MCGIAGSIGHAESGEVVSEKIHAALDCVRHRGPDGTGYYSDPGVAFGHRRLSIIDLQRGHQPMISADDRFVITYNGEIYNYIELRSELEKSGARFQTESDTEVILEGFRTWGEELPRRLNGMFAFVLWDRREKRAFGARDPFGQKPLFLMRTGSRLVFASELRGVSAVAGVSPSLDPTALATYLAIEGFPAGLTPYTGVEQLPPGFFFAHSLDGAHRAERYYDPLRSRTAPRFGSEPELVAELDRLLEHAVRRSCRADVPLSILLSGGTDSASILSYLRKLDLSTPVTAFHFAMDDPKLGELPVVEEIARREGIELRSIRAAPGIFRALAEELLPELDQPIADPGFLPKAAVCREISRTHKVALGGDGGDELFYGYILFRAEEYRRRYEYIPLGIRERIIEPAVRSFRASSGYMGMTFLAKQFIRGAAAPSSRRLPRWMYELYGGGLLEYFTDKDAAREALERLDTHWDALEEEVKDCEPLFRIAQKLQRTYLPQYVLANSDRAAMRYGVELRAPLLDLELVSFVNALPDRAKLSGGRLKGLLKKVLETRLPQRIVHRKKVGFTFPVARLLRTELAPLVESVFQESELRKHGLLDARALASLVRRHRQGENCYKPLWTLMSLAIWLQRER